jgi:ligand-binding sensor domain-containing protein/signal transduction histidine kinase
VKPATAITLLILLFGYPFTADAHSYSPRFESFEAESGLSMNTVNDIVTDNRGYLWVATQAGLNRFHGSEFKIYLKGQHNSGPSENHISKLYYSKQGQLWLATRGGGLNLYHEDTDSFEVIDKQLLTFNTNNISDINEDNQGNLWFATQDQGIWVFSVKERRTVRHITAGQGEDSLLSNSVLCLYRDRHSRLWIGTEAGLQRADTKRQTLIRYDEFSPLQGQPIGAITDAFDRGIWLGTDKALYYFNPDKQQLTQNQEYSADAGIEITSLVQDRAGHVWIGMLNSGLGIFDPQSNKFSRHRHNPSHFDSLRSDSVNRLWIDDEQQLWIATKGAGLNMFYLNADYFNRVNDQSFAANNLGNNDVRSIYRDTQGILWIGTSTGLYQAMESTQGEITGFKLVNISGTQLHSSFISFIRQDRLGQYWIGTRGEGLYVLSQNRQEVRHFVHDKDNPASLPSDYLYTLFFDSKNTAWIGTRDAGLTHYVDGRFYTLGHKNADLQSLPVDEISQVLEDDLGQLWVSTYGGGLVRISLDGEMKRYSTDTQTAIPSKYLFSMFQTDAETLWIASSDGVFSFNTQNGAVRLFDKDKGLVGNVSYLMQLDAEQRLWIGTASGLSILDTRTLQINNYTMEDGLQDNEFNFGAGFLDSDNSLYLGGINGFNHIVQMALPLRQKPKAPVIEAFSVLNTEVRLQETPRFEQNKHISAADSITLSHKDMLFSLRFHSPSLHQARQLSYRYKLSGLHDQWLSDNNTHVAYFTGVSPGDYEFVVKALDIDGSESPVTRLKIHIPPPLWQTWWAYVSYGIAIFALASLVYYSQVQKYRRQLSLMQQVAQSEQRLQLALWASGDEFWDWDLNAHTISRTNTFLAYPQTETHFKSALKDFIYPTDIDAVFPKIDACLYEDAQDFELTYRAKDPHNNWIWVLNRGKVTEVNSDGKAVRLTGTIKNIQSLKEAEAALRQLNLELEDRVRSRTEELQATNDELSEALTELELTQTELLDKEKMAALGGLVASITHEMNTPIGISVTASSHLQERVKRFSQSFEQGEVDKNDFEQYQQEVANCADLMLKNLQRASKLIASFKQVSVDQSHEELREFSLSQYIEDIFRALNPMLSRTAHKYGYHCPDNLRVYSSPGVFYQIISNLINNSLAHGYPDGKAGILKLSVSQNDKGLSLIYQDDGLGMTREVQDHIFDPFFTTKRGKGGSGLGMNIVYNLVTQVLHGSISLESVPGEGVTFTITLPASILVADKKKSEPVSASDPAHL